MSSSKQALLQLLSTFLPELSSEELERGLSVPPDRTKGDWAFPCFALAKVRKQNPATIASALANAMELPAGFSKVEAVGGYLNFFVDPLANTRSLLEKIEKEGDSFGEAEPNGKTVVVDYSSPNIGKLLAFHHLRSTMIGNSLLRCYRAAGWKGVGINHLGDWGTQFGKLIVMARRSGKPLDDEALKSFDLPTLNALYVEFGKQAKENPELEEEARAAFAAMEAGDPEALRLWRSFRATTLAEIEELYQMLNVQFDDYTGESFFNDKTDEVVELLKEKSLLTESQERQIVSLEAEEMPPCLILKGDGSTLYATRDLAAALHRYRTYRFDRCLYVVDNGQSLHFKQVFTVLKKMGYSWAEGCIHIPFGLILQRDEEGKWSKGSSKQGNSNSLREVIEAARDVILEMIESKNPGLQNKEQTALEIGIGALVFNDLKNRRLIDVKFDWDQVLSFEGDTGPYVQNAHVRLCSILRKADGVSKSRTTRWDKLLDDHSQQLIQTLELYPQRIVQVTIDNEPSVLAQYCLQLAEAAHRFIHHNRVLGSDEEQERLFLVKCTQQVLRNALRLLGISPVEQM